MKIAVTATEGSENGLLDTRFGRTAWFVVFDTETKTYTNIQNEQNLNLPQGAGIQSAALVVNSGAKVLISSHCGPKAFSTLNKGGVELYLAADGTVKECIEKFQKGLLRKSDGADVEGHW